MKSLNKLIVLLLITIILILGTTGCWNRRELPSLAIVLGVGVDKVEDNDNLQLTAQIVKTGELKASSAKEDGSDSGSKGDNEGSGAGAYWNIRNTGKSIFATLRDFTHKSSRKLYFPHNKIIVFGRSLAEQGVQEHLDFFLRDQETRFDVFVLVAEDKASEIFDVQPKLEKVPAINILDLLEAQKATSQTSVVYLDQFINRLMSETTAPIAPIIEILGKGNNKELSVAGTAVFDQDKFIGQMNKAETRGLLWVIDKVKSGIIDVDCLNDDGSVSLEIIRSKTKITSDIVDSQPLIRIDIKTEGNIASQTCSDNLFAPDVVAALEEKESKAIQAEVKAALSKAQKLNADVFGFGEVIHQRHRHEWTDLKDQWNEIFPDLDVEVIVEAKIRRSGSIRRLDIPEREQ